MEKKAYIVRSNRWVEEVEIVKDEQDFYIVGNRERQSGFRIRRSRIFATRQEAEKHLPYKKMPAQLIPADAGKTTVRRKPGGFASPYDYE